MCLDQFFTRPEIAKRCWAWLREELPETSLIIEPSAGAGAFFNLFPADRRRAFDIDPALAVGEVQQADFLSLTDLGEGWPEDAAVVGNPPFGFRGGQAVKFIEHSFRLGAAVVAFIVPQSVLRRRIKGGGLVRSMPIPSDAFILPGGTDAEVPACGFGVWERGYVPEVAHVDVPIRLYIIRKGSNEGKAERCDVFLPRRYYAGGETPLPSTEWNYDDMVGVEIRGKDEKLRDWMLKFNWAAEAPRGMNGSINLNYAFIKEQVARHRPSWASSRAYSAG